MPFTHPDSDDIIFLLTTILCHWYDSLHFIHEATLSRDGKPDPFVLRGYALSVVLCLVGLEPASGFSGLLASPATFTGMK